jgi:hypothetical protein
MRKIALVAIMLATALSAIALVSPAKAKGPPLSAALANPNVCWQFQGEVITGAQARGFIDRTLADPEAKASVEWDGSEISLHYYGVTDRSRHIGNFYRIPCPDALKAQAFFGGLNLNLGVGSLRGSNDVTNLQLFTLCPPAAPCTPDRTPNAAANLNSSNARGSVSLEYLFQPWQGMFIGIEGIYGFGSSTATIPTIPGTFGDGGIATPAAAAHDSTSVKFGNNFGLLGEVGGILTFGNMPFFVAAEGGIGWQRTELTFNCTTQGACGTNGIPAQSLTTAQTPSGSIYGGKVKFPLIAVVPSGWVGDWLSRSTIGFDYLHGDFGNVTTTLGTPTQFQVTANQHIKTDSFMGTLSVPLLPGFGATASGPQPSGIQRNFLP